MQKLKTTPKEIDYDAPIKSDKWKNLYFDKNGKSFRGIKNFICEKEALNYAKDCLSNNYYWLDTIDGKLEVKNARYAIQIPWKE